MAARKNLRHPDIVRRRIQTSQLINRLTSHVLGEVEMKPSQVTAALGLLKKTVPDLSAVEHSGFVSQRAPGEMTEAELERIAAGSSNRAAETPQSTQEPPAVH